ncbi:MAG: hypothetical protein E7172_04185 [Firmicutes bacterium]|nr:hypothetical protein [Bacillota bacterium]
MKKKLYLLLSFVFLLIAASGCDFFELLIDHGVTSYSLETIPKYNGESYVVINNNEPNFSEEDKLKESFESYSQLDKLGRCGVAMAKINKELMPTKERTSIGMIKPSGWKQAKYDFVDGKYLYNRCHLIGFQLTGENANEKNLITCTRSMNTEVMVDFENQIASYIKETENEVLYRVTPIFEGNNLLASGVQLEALSVEDNGKGIKFNVYIFNVEKNVEINYEDGSSKAK